jgi:hypothetical protein
MGKIRLKSYLRMVRLPFFVLQHNGSPLYLYLLSIVTKEGKKIKLISRKCLINAKTSYDVDCKRLWLVPFGGCHVRKLRKEIVGSQLGHQIGVKRNQSGLLSHRLIYHRHLCTCKGMVTSDHQYVKRHLSKLGKKYL